MTLLSPCADRASNDPQDWFIRPDGKQYTDDDLLDADERRRITLSVLLKEGETTDEHEERARLARNAARNNRRRTMLTRRRQAKEKCYGCPIREACLTQALDQGQMHGTWGGLFEEELAEVRKEQARRRRRRGNEATLLT